MRAMDFSVVSASEVDESLAAQIGVCLSRAFTDERHTRTYTAEMHANLDAGIARVHGSPPTAGELMPPEWMARFPSWRNFRRPGGERREAFHILGRTDGYVASHVALFAQRFDFDGRQVRAGYIEDVATDPLHLGQGAATAALRFAEHYARSLELEVLGLATGIPEFYARLGWRLWFGTHMVRKGEVVFADEPLMLFPLSEAGEWLTTQSGDLQSERLQRFGD